MFAAVSDCGASSGSHVMGGQYRPRAWLRDDDAVVEQPLDWLLHPGELHTHGGEHLADRLPAHQPPILVSDRSAVEGDAIGPSGQFEGESDLGPVLAHEADAG